jgi:hypothetical protein
MAILKVANIHFDVTGSTRLQANGANVLTFVTGSTEDARFDASGNLLIGRVNSTVGQGVKLDVAGAINASAVLINGAPALTGGITSNVVISVADNTNAALRITQTGTGDAIRVEDSTNPDSTPFIVDASGNVSIGSTITDTKLKVVTTTQSTDGITLVNTNKGVMVLMPNTSSGALNTLVTAGDQALIAYGNAVETGNLVLGVWSNSAKGIKIQDSGNVLIGRSTSTVGQGVILDVAGAINTSAVLVNGVSILTIANSYGTSVGTAGNNYTNAVGTAGNNYTNAVGTAGNNYTNAVGTAGNNFTIAVGAASNGRANIVGTAGNNYTNAVGTAGNNYTIAVAAAGNAYATFIGTVGNNFTTAVGTAGNNYTVAVSTSVGTAGNNYTNAVGAASNTIAIAAFTKANSTSYTSNLVISVADNTNAALRITQTGTGNALLVEDSANPDATPFVVNANGGVGIGTIPGSLTNSGLSGKFAVDGAVAGGSFNESFNYSSPASFSTSGVITNLAIPLYAGGSNVRALGVSYNSTLFSIIRASSNNKIAGVFNDLAIDESGNVLIGRTTSTVGLGVKLDVNGAINASAVYVNGGAITGGGAAVFSANVGNNSANLFSISHNLNKNFVVPAVRENSTGYYVYPDMRHTSANTIVLEFVTAPTTNQYTVIVLG